MRSRRGTVRACVLAAGLALAAGAVAEQGKSAHQGDYPRANGQDLWNYIKAQDYQKKWSLWPGKKKFYRSQSSSHGDLLTTYVNPVAEKALKNGGLDSVLPYHSIVVKENYSRDRKLKAHTVMYRLKGYNPYHNDWFWLKVKPGGKVAKSGKIKMCQNCHRNARMGYTFALRGAAK